MRWIFFTLLFVNVAAFAWGMVVTSHVSEASLPKKSPKRAPNVTSLALYSERDKGISIEGQSLEGQKALSAQVEPAEEDEFVEQSVSGSVIAGAEEPVAFASKNDPVKNLCNMVGPFSTQDDAAVLEQRLTAVDVASKIKNLDLPAGKRYQVFLPPEPSKDAAFKRLAELQANGVDSYVIRKGPMANSISLGLFRRKSFAESHINHLKTLGLDPKIDVLEDTVREIWVVLDKGEGSKISNLTWKTVMEDINNVEIRQNFCLDVASGDNIH